MTFEDRVVRSESFSETDPPICHVHAIWSEVDHTWWTASEQNFHHLYDVAEMCCEAICGGDWECDDNIQNNYGFFGSTTPPGTYGAFEELTHRKDCDDWLHSVARTDRDTSFSFRKFVPKVEKQLVVMHFKWMDYHRAPDETFDPSLITFHGEPGFWYDESQHEVGFLFEITIGETYTIDRQSFTWPDVDYFVDTGGLCLWRVIGREMWFSEWGNAELLSIYRDGRNITGQEVPVWAGERLNLQANVNPNFTVVPESFAWVVTGDHIKNWEATEPSSTEEYLSESDLREQSISFAWKDDGTTEDGERQPSVVECRVQVENVAEQVAVSTVFIVKEFTRSVQVKSDGQIRFWAPPANWFGVHYGAIAGGGGPGVSFETSPVSYMDLAWVQVGDVTRRWTLDSGETVVRQGVALDDVEYHAHYYSDSPANRIFPDFTRIEVEDAYETHLLFKPKRSLSGWRPTEGVWVPLKRYTWEWGVDVTRDLEQFPDNNGWPVAPLPHPGLPEGADSDTYPSWENTFE